MAVFDEVLAQIREKAGEIPEVISAVDALATEYQNTVTQLDGATVRLSERDEAMVASQLEISRLKGENYDLSIKVQAAPPANSGADENDENDGPTGAASLFNWKK